MSAVASLVVVGILCLAVLGAAGWGASPLVFGVVIPYAAFAVFLIGVVWRVLRWASSPVPFRVPTSCGQQKSLPWIPSSRLDNPHTALGTAARMALEVLLFRSLFRNTRSELGKGAKLVYADSPWLWAAGLAFHWSFLVIVVRHLRFFMEPVPFLVLGIQRLDGLMQVGVPVVFATDAAILAAVTYLFLRRIVIPQVRYVSLAADYFPLLLILGIAGSGVLMRYFVRVDIVGVKELAMGLATMHPAAKPGLGTVFYVHIFLVSALLAYLPFSKIMHMGGVFLSPTRNLANNNRMKRHVNPWNPEVKVHTYEEYEDEFRDVMKAAGLPLDREK